MQLPTAIGHIAGSILAWTVLGIVVWLFEAWLLQRHQKRQLEEIAIELGISEDDLDNEELAPKLGPKLVQRSSERFSNELFRNRISDLCGVARTLWNWFAALLQVVVLLGVVWYTITESRDNAVYAWFVVAIYVFAWVVSLVFTLLCLVLTGRYPGEARLARRSAAEFLKHRPASAELTHR